MPLLPLKRKLFEEPSKLEDDASRVFKVARVSVQGAPTAASIATTAAAETPPLTPDPQKTAGTIKQSVKKEKNLEALLKMTPPGREIVLKGLSDKDLKTFEVALSKRNNFARS